MSDETEKNFDNMTLDELKAEARNVTTKNEEAIAKAEKEAEEPEYQIVDIPEDENEDTAEADVSAGKSEKSAKDEKFTEVFEGVTLEATSKEGLLEKKNEYLVAKAHRLNQDYTTKTQALAAQRAELEKAKSAPPPPEIKVPDINIEELREQLEDDPSSAATLLKAIVDNQKTIAEQQAKILGKYQAEEEKSQQEESERLFRAKIVEDAKARGITLTEQEVANELKELTDIVNALTMDGVEGIQKFRNLKSQTKTETKPDSKAKAEEKTVKPATTLSNSGGNNFGKLTQDQREAEKRLQGTQEGRTPREVMADLLLVEGKKRVVRT